MCLVISVRHRIDGLESDINAAKNILTVRHRIDGLEKWLGKHPVCTHVRHRIDGLETSALGADAT